MDSQLVIRAQSGDEAAFAAIIERAYVGLRRVAFRILRDRDVAEDATQRALVGIWRKLPTLRDPERFDAWAWRFVVRACADEMRARRRALPWTLALDMSSGPDRTSDVLDRDEMERAFRCLSLEQRAVIVLRHYLDLTLDDTAAALGVPVGTVNSRLARATDRLRAELAAEREPRPGRPLEAVR